MDSQPFSFLGEELLSKTGKVPISVLNDAPAVAIYFSAHWCPPCKRFTPELAKFYDAANENGKSVEIVFVSMDQNEEAFGKYYKLMPWLAVPFSQEKA